VKYSDTITWVKSFKDVYQKYLKASLVQGESQMPYFYLRHSTFIAVFRTETVEGKKQIIAELVAS
jgi:hypothetical protein